ncbi:MAG: sigma-54 factor interaction domain-containing protein, partial [Myxococcota bacterium]
MRQASVVLIDVSIRYAGPIRHRCREPLFAITWEEQTSRGAAAFEGCALCVLGSGGDLRALARRVNRVREALGECPIVVLGDALNVEAVVDLMRRGAADVISLPADPTEVALQVLSHADPRGVDAGQGAFVGNAPAVQRVRRRMRAVARTSSTVLLTGETGCGKGVAAREIHRLSERRERPFIHVDCAALASSVIDSELFGHERGAFTGAIGRHAGRFERAEGGTIFLDEIGDLDLALQSKLLRVLQEREYERLGGSRTQS